VQLPIELIIEPRNLLRFPDRNGIEYLELLSSIQNDGQLQSILVRPSKRQPGKYEVVDGMCRYTACKQLGVPVMQVTVKDMADDEVLVHQIKCNAIGLETKPVEYAAQIAKIMRANKSLTLPQIAGKLNKSPEWVRRTLGLLRLTVKCQDAVNKGTMPLSSAYILSTLPKRLQNEQFENACQCTTQEFRALAAGVVKKFREAVKQGRLEAYYDAEFEPQPYLRPLNEVLNEIKHRHFGPVAVAGAKIKSAIDGFYLGLKWAASLDPLSVRNQKKAAEGRIAKQLHTKAKRKKRQ
jgi:ParB/RepB/Spo0J family partition protein